MPHKVDNGTRPAIERACHIAPGGWAHTSQSERFSRSAGRHGFNQVLPFAFNVEDTLLVYGGDGNSHDFQRAIEREAVAPLLFRDAAHEVEARGQQFAVGVTQVFPGDGSN